MTTFKDQLFADLMEEYRPVLQHLERPVAPGRTRRVPVRRVAWLTGVATAGAVAAGVTLIGGGTPAYAVTQHPDGTVTVSVDRPAGVQPANAKLRVLGDQVVVVPVRPGCPSITSLPHPLVAPSGRISGSVRQGNGKITVDVHGIPAGDTMIIAFGTLPGGGRQGAGILISGPVPSCVSLPAPSAGNGRLGGSSGNG